MTAVQAGKLMSEVGMVEAMQLVAKAFTLAFPQQDPNGPLPGLPGGNPLGSTGTAH
jgi:hypothetical protein